MTSIKTLWLKSCPRCKGDLIKQLDIYGHYIKCLQCGYIEEGKL